MPDGACALVAAAAAPELECRTLPGVTVILRAWPVLLLCFACEAEPTPEATDVADAEVVQDAAADPDTAGDPDAAEPDPDAAEPDPDAAEPDAEPEPDAAEPDAGPAPECDPVAAVPRLLTRFEYDNTVQALLREPTRPAAALPAENRVLGFDNNAEAHQATPLHVEKYLELAEALALGAAERGIEQLAGCEPAAEGCRETFIGDFGRRAFRRPLHRDEAAIYSKLWNDTVEREDAPTAARITLTAILQSPQFLYRVDLPLEEAEGAPTPYGHFAMASRLSYFLLGGPPDEALLAAAEAGALGTAEEVEAQARRLLAEPAATRAFEHFHRQWLDLDAVENLAKDGVADLEGYRENLMESIYALVLTAWQREEGLAALLASPRLTVSGELARVLDLPEGEHTLEGERAGLLTHPTVLARLAHPDQTSPIRRGIFVRERLLCQPLPPPPPEVPAEPPDPDPEATTRERFAQHTEEPLCQGCHILIDPLGFGFEGYDHLGRLRDEENGQPIDDSGEVVGAPDPALDGPFEGALELAERLADSAVVGDCLATQWFRYALARGERREDRCAVEAARQALRASGGDFRELLVALALSNTFRTRTGSTVEAVDPLPDLQADPEPPEPVEDRAPVGALEGVDEAGFVHGWTFDPDTPDFGSVVELWLDGVPGEGRFLVALRANQPRPDVNEAHPDLPGDHGFRGLLPAEARDGLPHTLSAVSLNTGAGEHAVLENSPMAFRAGLNASPPEADPPVPNRFSPQGRIEAVEAGEACGWALDRDLVGAVTVHLWVDGPALAGGVDGGAVQTSIYREDVESALRHEGSHGWCVQLPEVFRDGQAHSLRAYAYNAGNPGNTEIDSSPFEFTWGAE